MTPKILSRASLERVVRWLKQQKRRIVFTNGTFDLLHLGHVTYLEKAKKAGDVLIVGVNTDASVKSYKAPDRPLNCLSDRMRVLTALACVDYAVAFSEPTPLKLIMKIRPDVLVKGADWKKSEIAGAREVESWGGRVKRIALVPGRSTTRLLKLLNHA
jgi:D-beta-D-heptose 7-phosphate kinase/D-beta-D-heptose 1-phosphate adenosyltransferase